MSEAPSRFPLAWPPGRPRKRDRDRVRGAFTAANRRIDFAAAVARLEAEIDRLGGVYPLLSSNLELRLDGRPRLDSRPDDPGVCLYFHIKGEPYAMACDTYTEVAQNAAAIAEHVKATRLIARYGVATAAETLQAFRALPPPATERPKRPWWIVLGIERAGADADVVRAVFKAKAHKAHPDKGGTVEAMAELNTALAEAIAEVGR